MIAEMTLQFIFDEDEEPMATESIFLSSDESDYSDPNSTHDHFPARNYPDSYNAINYLKASQLEQKSIVGTATLLRPPTPNASLTSDDDEQHNPTPIIGNRAQYTSHIPQRHQQPLQLCQQLQPILDPPESPMEDQDYEHIFSPCDLPNSLTTISHNSLPNFSALVDGLQNLKSHTHLEHNEWVTGCLVR